MKGEMFRLLAVLIIPMVGGREQGHRDELNTMISTVVASAINRWCSHLTNPVVVYRGFDVSIPCLANSHAKRLRRTSGNQSYVWYDNDNVTISGLRLTVADKGALHIQSAMPSDTGRYTCIAAPTPTPQQMTRRQRHDVVVVLIPTVAVDYQFVYRVPMCDSLRMSQKAEWYSFQAEQENARQSDEDGIELVVSNYSCSLAARNVRGFNAAYHLYTLVISAKLNGFAERLRQYRSLLDAATGGCRVRCQLRNIVNTIVNQSRPVIEKWKADELEDKIYGEERMMNGEMKFPEFLFKPSQLAYNVTLHCNDTTGTAPSAGYAVLRRAVCVPCLPGTFFNPVADNCTRCPLNTYQDRLAARSCIRCHRNHYTQHVGSKSSGQCEYHMLAMFAHRLPSHYVVVAALVLCFLLFNCLYALIVNRRQLAKPADATRQSRGPVRDVPAVSPSRQQTGQRHPDAAVKHETRPLLSRVPATPPPPPHTQRQPVPPTSTNAPARPITAAAAAVY